jgi:hypothetical protein
MSRYRLLVHRRVRSLLVGVKDLLLLRRARQPLVLIMRLPRRCIKEPNGTSLILLTLIRKIIDLVLLLLLMNVDPLKLVVMIVA